MPTFQKILEAAVQSEKITTDLQPVTKRSAHLPAFKMPKCAVPNITHYAHTKSPTTSTNCSCGTLGAGNEGLLVQGGDGAADY